MKIWVNRKNFFEFDITRGIIKEAQCDVELEFTPYYMKKVFFVCPICKTSKLYKMKGRLFYYPKPKWYNTTQDWYIGTMQLDNGGPRIEIGKVVANTDSYFTFVCSPECGDHYRFIPMGWI